MQLSAATIPLSLLAATNLRIVNSQQCGCPSNAQHCCFEWGGLRCDFGCAVGNCVFQIDYSASDGCSETKSALSLTGYMSNEPYPVTIGPHSPVCTAATASTADENNAFGFNGTTLDIYPVSDPSNIIGPDMCFETSDADGGCSYEYALIGNLRENPEIMANDNPEDIAAIQGNVYAAFYNDDECTDLAALAGVFTSGQIIEIAPATDPDLSCNAQAACAVDPNSRICNENKDEDADVATVVVETRMDEATSAVDVYECDTSNLAAGTVECAVQKPTKCFRSSVFSNCNVRYISGPTLATNPRVLVGDFGEEDEKMDDVHNDGEEDDHHDDADKAGSMDDGTSSSAYVLTESVYNVFVCFIIGVYPLLAQY